MGQDKIWGHYLNNILAADLYSAYILSTWLREAVKNKEYLKYLEVIDLQRYKVIKKMPKIRQAVKESNDEPFIFVVGRN